MSTSRFSGEIPFEETGAALAEADTEVEAAQVESGGSEVRLNKVAAVRAAIERNIERANQNWRPPILHE